MISTLLSVHTVFIRFFLQGGEKRSGNVLELMKEYRKEMTHSDEEEVVPNGQNLKGRSSSTTNESFNSSNSNTKVREYFLWVSFADYPLFGGGGGQRVEL